MLTAKTWPTPHLTSLTRIIDLSRGGYSVQALPRTQWATGDYVLSEVTAGGGGEMRLELITGREIQPAVFDHVVGALGVRAATLEAVGDWRAIGDDGLMSALTGAGLFGRVTSQSVSLGSLIQLRYEGHLLRDGEKLHMASGLAAPANPPARLPPVILIMGTSMSAGKTASAQAVVRLLSRAGRRVVGAKLTGAGRYRDILALRDAGAAAVFDFVDVGLPSTVCPAESYRVALNRLLNQIAGVSADVIVAEAGASPLEPYNGHAAMEILRPHVRLTILCASDPYAVVGVTQGFGFQPDFVSGVATSTSAGCDVVERLAGLPALNLIDSASRPALADWLRRQCGADVC
jgi:hypothetical protein